MPENLIKQSNVTLLCTTDDPIDDLKWHKVIREDETFDVQVLPAWRPDKAMNLEKPGISGIYSETGGSFRHTDQDFLQI